MCAQKMAPLARNEFMRFIDRRLRSAVNFVNVWNIVWKYEARHALLSFQATVTFGRFILDRELYMFLKYQFVPCARFLC